MKIDIKKKQIFSTISQARISNILKYFLSETIQAQENWSTSTHFSNFLTYLLSYSALILFSSNGLASSCNYAMLIADTFEIVKDKKTNKEEEVVSRTSRVKFGHCKL